MTSFNKIARQMTEMFQRKRNICIDVEISFITTSV